MTAARLQSLITTVLDGAESPNTRRAYAHQLELFASWWAQVQPERFDKSAVRAFLKFMRAEGHGASSRNQALTCLRRLAAEAADNDMLDGSLAAGVGRIKPAKRLGRRTGNWLTQDQARALVRAPDPTTLKGKRDRVIHALLLECGLRRDEAVQLDVSQIQIRKERMVLADLKGKGARTRTVPVPWRAAQKIEDWLSSAGIDNGRVLRPVDKCDRLAGESISSTALYKHVIADSLAQLGTRIAPHDLRRTFAQLARAGGAELDQIQATLGHSGIRTTQLYLGEHQALDRGAAPCDKIHIEDTSQDQDQDQDQDKDKDKDNANDE